jgi:hypothetical protein
MSNVGGSSAAAIGLDGVLSALSDRCHKIQFLVALADSTVGASLLPTLTETLVTQVREGTGIDAWVPVRVVPRDRMTALTAANRAVLATPILAEEQKKELAGLIDEVLSRYLVEEGVIEKIDKADDPLALRAMRLLKFCGSGVLIQGKSQDLARRRVIEHLRQPQFEAKFLASVPNPNQAEQFLREFHRLLVDVGFKS